MPYIVAVEGIQSLAEFDQLDDQIKRKASMTVNATLRKARTWGGAKMRDQINFQVSYLTGSSGNLKITQNATPGNPKGVLQGRGRATSLARFADKRVVPTGRQNGVTVSVKPDGARHMRNAFLVKLNAGPSFSEDNYNIGLAIRLKPGETIKNKKKMIAASKTNAKWANVYLLYGPSVDQVFRKVADDLTPDIGEFMETEFLRLMRLENV